MSLALDGSHQDTDMAVEDADHPYHEIDEMFAVPILPCDSRDISTGRVEDEVNKWKNDKRGVPAEITTLMGTKCQKGSTNGSGHKTLVSTVTHRETERGYSTSTSRSSLCRFAHTQSLEFKV